VVSAGLAASPALDMTVMPFIIRGVSLLGVSSAAAPRALREQGWEKLAGDWKPRHLEAICTREVGLDGLADVFEAMLAGGAVGRTVVRID
jgi:NADPH:quinone reductase-like Zn-dependent oxidoreductase